MDARREEYQREREREKERGEKNVSIYKQYEENP